MDEDGLRTLFAQKQEQAGNDATYSVVDEHFDLLVSLGSLRYPAVMEWVLQNQAWPENEVYLGRALRFHVQDAAAAVAYPPAAADDMRRAHPELYVLPRRQHALRLLRAGQHLQARHFYEQRIQAQLLGVRRNAHVDSLVTTLREILDQVRPWDYDSEAASTYRSIKDYLQLYFPRLCTDPTMELNSKRKLGEAWRFGEVPMPLAGDMLGPATTVRCLVCHARLPHRTCPDATLMEQLDMHCPAMTPRLHRLLPRAIHPRHAQRRLQLQQQDQAAAAAAHGHNAGPPAGDE